MPQLVNSVHAIAVSLNRREEKKSDCMLMYGIDSSQCNTRTVHIIWFVQIDDLIIETLMNDER